MYRTAPGDTFETVSRKVYGSEQYAQNIRGANPGAVFPFAVGSALFIPDIPGAPQNAPQKFASSQADEVTVEIGGSELRFWTSIEITQSLDSFSTLTLSAPFEPSDPKFRELFRPLSYQSITVAVGGSALFSGVLMNVDPDLQPSRRAVTITAYSRAAILGDCNAPASAFPIEYNDLDLEGIASALCTPFGIGVEFASEPGAPFDRVEVEPSETILSFLVTLAQQRGLIISDNAAGELRFAQSTAAGDPVASFSEGSQPVESVVATISPQSFYSHITGIKPYTTEEDGGLYTKLIPQLSGVLRPLTFKAGDIETGDLKSAVEAKAARMFGNAITYSMPVASWFDPAGDLWAPNKTIKLTAPGAMIYNPTELLIRSVTLRKEASTVAELELVLPGSFRGEIPEGFPWD